MAKVSKVVKNARRGELVARYAERRRELKAIISSPASTHPERAAAQRRLQALPRDSSPTRYRSRDAVDGRPRGMMPKFGIHRIRFRTMAHAGQLPGITKSSW
ncbi:MAG: 30S ribosomal protein S14 [Actinomycetales bacterium]